MMMMSLGKYCTVIIKYQEVWSEASEYLQWGYLQSVRNNLNTIRSQCCNYVSYASNLLAPVPIISAMIEQRCLHECKYSSNKYTNS